MTCLRRVCLVLAGAALGGFVLSAPAHADTIYSQVLGTGGANAAMDTIGWSAYRNIGTDYSAGPVPPTLGALAYRGSGNALIASSSTELGTHMALLSIAGTISPAAYGSDLTISFTENATDDGGASPGMGWRLLAQVGSTIYASDFVSFTVNPATTTHDLIVADSIWHVWTGETDLSDGFDIANISGTAGNLAAGTISGLGVLAIDGVDNNDRLRLFDYSITATAVPEPTTLGVLGAGVGLLALRAARRKRAAPKGARERTDCGLGSRALP